MNLEKTNNVFPEIPNNFHSGVMNALDLTQKPESESVKKSGFKTLKFKIIAVAAAMAIVFTLGVGAFNGWNYANVFGRIFNTAESDFKAPHVIKPEIKNMTSTFDEFDLEVLGVAGDYKSLYFVFELTAKNGYKFDTEHLRGFDQVEIWNYTLAESGKSAIEATRNGKPINAADEFYSTDEDGLVIAQNFDINHSSGCFSPEITETSVILTCVFDFLEFELEKGSANMYLSDLVYYDNDGGNRQKTEGVIFFDVSIDFPFYEIKKFDDVNTVSNMPEWLSNDRYTTEVFPTVPVFLKSVEVTPVAVRFTTESKLYDGFYSIAVKLKNGDVISKDDFESGSGGNISDDLTYTSHFKTPIDLNEVYSVIIGDVELKF